MEFTKEMKLIYQRRMLLLSCYKSQKEGKPIAEVCPFKKTSIDETCKHCQWFKITDESNQVAAWLKEKEVQPGTPVIIDLEAIEFSRVPTPEELEKIDRGGV